MALLCGIMLLLLLLLRSTLPPLLLLPFMRAAAPDMLLLLNAADGEGAATPAKEKGLLPVAKPPNRLPALLLGFLVCRGAAGGCWGAAAAAAVEVAAAGAAAPLPLLLPFMPELMGWLSGGMRPAVVLCSCACCACCCAGSAVT